MGHYGIRSIQQSCLCVRSNMKESQTSKINVFSYNLAVLAVIFAYKYIHESEFCLGGMYVQLITVN